MTGIFSTTSVLSWIPMRIEDSFENVIGTISTKSKARSVPKNTNVRVHLRIRAGAIKPVAQNASGNFVEVELEHIKVVYKLGRAIRVPRDLVAEVNNDRHRMYSSFILSSIRTNDSEVSYLHSKILKKR